MPSFAESLEKTLHQALKNASDRSHEYATLEHLLLALVDDGDKIGNACCVIRIVGVDLEKFDLVAVVSFKRVHDGLRFGALQSVMRPE